MTWRLMNFDKISPLKTHYEDILTWTLGMKNDEISQKQIVKETKKSLKILFFKRYLFN
jgi:hypothetical protein